MRVLFTASTASHIRNFHRPYLRAFRDMGWTVAVACGGDPASIPEADEALPLPFEKKMTAPSNFRAQRLLRRFLEETPCDLVCTHTSLAAFFTRRAAAGLSKRPKVINVAHGYLFDDNTPALKRTILLAAEKLTAGQTDLLLTMNECDLRLAQKHRLGRRVAPIPGMGVDFSRLDGVAGLDRDGLRAELGFGPDDFVLVYAAEFSGRKNQELLIRALPELPERVKLLLPGQGALWDTCRDLALELGVAGRVVFPGQIKDMVPLYAAADGAAPSSRSEGLPFNVMEAMYAGLPVVASAVKGHTDLIEHGRTGLLYPYGDKDAFVQEVAKLLDDPELGHAMGAAAREAMAPYALEQVLPQVMKEYTSLLPEGQAASV